MVVVDSSALIPLAWIGRLNLVTKTFDEVHTTENVRTEVLTGGKRGTAALRDFLEDVSVHRTPPEAVDIADLEGVTVADASVILVASDTSGTLLANDKALIEVAKSHGIECWWVTTVLLKATKDGTLSSSEAVDTLYELVDEGMYLHPKVYARVQKALRELGG